MGKDKVVLQVFALGSDPSVKATSAVVSKPDGGISLAPVVKTKTSDSVALVSPSETRQEVEVDAIS